MSKPVKIGVVGVGTVSLRGLVPHLVEPDLKDRVVLTALCDPAADRASGAAARFGVPQAFTSYDEFLANADVDAITLATPIGLHYEQGRAALLAGKHVHFNKTMTVTTAEATELIDLAERLNLRIVASPGEMLRPHNKAIKAMIAEGRLGTLAWAICGAAFENYHEDEPERGLAPGGASIDPSWYFRKPGGGPLYDMTVYALHGLTGILCPAKKVTAFSGVRLPQRSFAGRIIPTEADDNTLMLLDFGDSLFAVVYGAMAGGCAICSTSAARILEPRERSPVSCSMGSLSTTRGGRLRSWRLTGESDLALAATNGFCQTSSVGIATSRSNTCSPTSCNSSTGSGTAFRRRSPRTMPAM